MKNARRVLIHFGVHNSHWMDVSMALRRYGRERGTMVFPALPGEFDVLPGPSTLRRFDAVATLVSSRTRESRVLKAGLPAVNFSDTLLENRLPTVVTDSRAVGRMAADYFLELGHESFAHWGDWTASYSIRQSEAFCERVMASGRCRSFRQARRFSRPWEITPSSMQKVKAWLRALPKPCALLCSLDLYASVAAELAIGAGLTVPDDIAVMGVGDDAFFANYGAVPVSSVRLPSEAMGKKIGECLEALLEGKLSGVPRFEIPPLGITERLSTCSSHSGHPILRAALAHIRAHAMDALKVGDVVRHTGYSRATLQNLFRDHLGRTILDEIWRQKLRGIKELVAADRLTLEAIAERAGISSAQRLCAVFRKQTGMTPGEFRSAARGGRIVF